MKDLIFDEASHTYSMGGVAIPSVTQIIKEAGLAGTYDHISPSRLEHLADKGRKIHLACEYENQGLLDVSSLDEKILPYVEGWKKFKKECGFEVVASEIRLYHKKYMFAGTIDVVGKLFGETSIIDIKSGSMNPGTKYQLAGYKVLWNDNTVSQIATKRYVVQLKLNDYKIYKYLDISDESTFLTAVQKLKEN